MKAGVYDVLAIKSAGLTGEGDDVKPFIRFELQTEDGPKGLSWFGNLKGNNEENTQKAQKHTAKSLVTAGFISNDLEDLLQPVEMVFNKKELTVTVELYKEKPQIKWINEKRAPKEKKEFKGSVPKFASLFAQVKKDMGIDEIPF